MTKLKELLAEEVERVEDEKRRDFRLPQRHQTVASLATTTSVPTSAETLSPFHYNHDYFRRKTAKSQTEQTSNSASPDQSQRPWYKKASPLENTTHDAQAALNELINIIDPGSIISGIMNTTVLSPLRQISSITQRLVPPALRFERVSEHIPEKLTEDLMKMIEKLTKLIVHDLPQIALKMPTTLHQLSQTLDQIRVNGTEMAKKCDDKDVMSRARNNIVAWSILLTQTGMMSMVSAELAVRAGFKMLRVSRIVIIFIIIFNLTLLKLLCVGYEII